MTPAARTAAAIEALAAIEGSDEPADRVLAGWGRAHRFAGSGDRAAIADLVYRCLRRRRSLAWRLRDDSPRAAVIGALAADGADLDALLSGVGHAAAPLSRAERAALAAPAPPAPDPVRLDYPDWLDGALRLSLGAGFEASMQALQARAPVDLRVNTLRCGVGEARAALAADGVAVETGPHGALCLRAAPGAAISRTRAYADGLVELQDAASQAVAAFVAARPGEVVLDYCAGGGGKTLALAAAMGGRGRLIAHDVAPRRMADLPRRLARADARCDIIATSELASLHGRCDAVLVDAPCSGSGSWRRDPGGKWRLTPARLAALLATQTAALAQAARYVRPGGRLIHATCSLLAAENKAVAESLPRARIAEALSLSPADGADGFYAARLTLCAAVDTPKSHVTTET